MEISIKLTQQHLHVIGAALGERPFREAAPVIAAIEKQIADHNKMVAADGGEPEKDRT